jgi:hypothetical protein
MRHIGTIAEKKQAERFVHFLAAQQTEATLRPLQETGYAVWVIDEERIATARQQLETFLTMPDDPQFDVPEGHQPVWPDGSSSTACQRSARGTSMYVQKYFNGGVYRLSL